MIYLLVLILLCLGWAEFRAGKLSATEYAKFDADMNKALHTGVKLALIVVAGGVTLFVGIGLMAVHAALND